MKKFGFGLIGCGAISDWHAYAIKETEGTELIGAFDRNAASAAAFCEKQGCRQFATIQELLSCEQIDVVCICTPSGLHAPLAIAAANAGKNIVVEKPMALTHEEIDTLLAACKDNGVKMAVISQLRFAPGVQALKGSYS